MDLYAEMQAETKQGGVKALMPRILAALSPDDREMVEKALADPMVSSRAIASVLTDHGYKVSAGTVNGYRGTT